MFRPGVDKFDLIIQIIWFCHELKTLEVKMYVVNLNSVEDLELFLSLHDTGSAGLSVIHNGSIN